MLKTLEYETHHENLQRATTPVLKHLSEKRLASERVASPLKKLGQLALPQTGLRSSIWFSLELEC